MFPSGPIPLAQPRWLDPKGDEAMRRPVTSDRVWSAGHLIALQGIHAAIR